MNSIFDLANMLFLFFHDNIDSFVAVDVNSYILVPQHETASD